MPPWIFEFEVFWDNYGGDAPRVSWTCHLEIGRNPGMDTQI